MSQRNAVYRATVLQPRDPSGLGRLQVRVQAFAEEIWARRATLAAGTRRGTWFVPDAGDDVLVAFENGDARKPFVVGALWNGKQRPPENDPERTLIRTKHGVTLVLDDGAGAVEITDSNGNAVKLESSGVTITAAAKVKISASIVEIDAAEIEINASMARFAGVVHCDTLIANSVVSASYTPGVGNVM
jgi:phage baseplate assembly protein V